MNKEERAQLVRKASVAALIGNGAICAAKIAAGLSAQSLSVLGDGIDSATDIAISGMTLAVSFIASRPSNKEYTWGHQRAETVASLVLSFMILTAGLQLLIASVKKLCAVFGGSVQLQLSHPYALAVTAASIAVKLALALNQYLLGKKADSIMIQANARNMTNDVILSASVLAGLGVSRLFNAPAFDAVTALLVSLWIIRSGGSLFMELNVELMDGNTDEALYKHLFEAAHSVEGAFHPHRARIRRMANLLDIDLDIEVAADLSVYEAHLIAEKVTAAIKNRLENVYDVMVHIEPLGVANNEEEGFGLSEADIR